MKFGTVELLHEDKADTNQSPPAAVKVEEEFLEPGDTDDLVWVIAATVAGFVIVMNVIRCGLYLKSKCKKNSDPDSDDVKYDALQLLKSLEEDQKVISDLVSKMDSRQSSKY